MENLPREIVIDILSRLPIKHLVRCRCVCRYWLNLTHDSRLVNLHLHRASQPNNNNPCLVLIPDNIPHNILHAIDLVNFCSQSLFIEIDEPSDCTPVKLNVPSFLNDFEVMGSCNGYSIDNCIAYVCNPCNGDYIKLPKLIISLSPFDFVGGFGFDQKTNQYKVVRIVYQQVDGAGGVNDQYQPEVYVYGLGGESSWRHIGKAPYCILGQFGSKAFVNGALHWVSSGPGKQIVSFDIADEVFDVIPWPLEEGSYSREVLSGHRHLSLAATNSYSLGVLRGCLSFVDSSSTYHFEIWVMNNYRVKESWTKYFTINYREFGNVGWSIGNIQILCFQKNGEVLLLYDHRTLFSCNPRTMTLRKLSLVGLPFLFNAVTYVGTLISPSRFSEDDQRIG